MRRTLIIVCLLVSAATAIAGSLWKGVSRIVAVGDVHGDYGQLVAALRSAGVIDARNKWSGGKTHLVQTGDLMDRGPDSRKILDLLMDLERQAKRSGGAVHALLGNHEALNIYGDLRYVTPEEFAAFRDADSEKVRRAFYEAHLKELAADPANAGSGEPDEAYRKAWEEKHPLGYFEHRFQYGPNGKYGRWIRAHNAVIQVNDTVFVHGGISPKYADMPFEQINNRIRDELNDFSMLKGGLIQDTEGPLWYRKLAAGEEADLAEHVQRFLDLHGARRMVIGHTPTAGAIMPRFGGKALLIDVGLSASHGSRLSCLVIEGDKAYALHRGERLLIPSDTGFPFLEYLKRAAALDPSPSPLEKTISGLETVLAAPVHD